MQSFSTHPHGKLLLSGEYAVLDGAVALAVPVRFGQSLKVTPGDEPGLAWTSLDHLDQSWFSARFSLPDLALLKTNDEKTAQTLLDLLHACRRQEPGFLQSETALIVETRLDFPRAWGLGTSSTLIAALGRWSDTDAYQLLFETLGGSGYDIACAYAEGPIMYQLDEGVPIVEPINWNPSFADRLYFIYLGKKQDSREGIRRYRDLTKGKTELVETLSAIGMHMTDAQNLETFGALMLEHERLVAQALELPRAKDLYFSDYPGEIKSLGAWGGDFVLVTGLENDEKTRGYFHGKGYDTVLGWGEMVK
jgi:mevalonate kinase